MGIFKNPFKQKKQKQPSRRPMYDIVFETNVVVDGIARTLTDMLANQSSANKAAGAANKAADAAQRAADEARVSMEGAQSAQAAIDSRTAEFEPFEPFDNGGEDTVE